MSDDVRWLDEPRPVEVLHDDRAWYAGEQEGWVRWLDGWRASVSWTVAAGEKFVRVVPADRVRPLS